VSLLPVFERLEATAIGVAIRESATLFPAIEVAHLFGLAILLAVVVVMNVRLLSLARPQPLLAAVALAAEPLFWAGLGVTLASGFALFLAEAVKCYFNDSFRYKMALLAFALLFHVTLHRRVRTSAAPNALAAKAAAAVSLALWFGTGVAGRFIGFT
jgi:hypothetical protein